MTETYSGGCACGAVRYEIAGEPVFSNDCQCRDCQSMSGAGHGSYLSFTGRGRMILQGQASEWDMVADSGGVKTRGFCGACGSPVYQTYRSQPDIITVHAGSLDDPGRYKPQAVTYAARGYAWDWLDPALPIFEGMPTP